jgi:hypothetical protein
MMEIACKLLFRLRAKKIVINKFLRTAGICPRAFYRWIEGDAVPSEKSKLKLQIALEVLEEVF